MQRGSLADLTAFVPVADHLSFREAASRLRVTASALSHSMRQLEERHGVRLLGQLRPAIDQIADALEDLNRERSRPFGRLCIYATRMAATAIIAPVWARFLSTYPDVHMELQVSEAPIDIVAKGFDAGLGPQDRAAADMTMRRVMGPVKVAVVGASSCSALRGRPRTPDDLTRHSCVEYQRGADGALLE